MKNTENKEREKVRFRTKNYYLVLQLCYNVILYLELRCSTITNFFCNSQVLQDRLLGGFKV